MRQGIKEKDIRDFEKYANKLCEVMLRIAEYKPDANAFLSCEGYLNTDLCLMSCDFHDLDNIDAQKCIVTSVKMFRFDGGGF